MKDLFGNSKPVLIANDEWWFNGRFIQKQDDYRLPTWISFSAGDESYLIEVHSSKKDAVKFCLENPCKKPDTLAQDYISFQ